MIKKITCIVLCSLFIFKQSIAQTNVQGTEIGFDGAFSASNLGGSFGIGVKFGFELNDHLILGPSVRLQRSWSKNVGTSYGYSVYGGGVWAHFRLAEYFFLGTEIELLNSPLSYTVISSSKKWIPTALVGGGFSKEFNEKFRLNVGIYYDVINNPNSPFRPGYVMKKSVGPNGQAGALIPVIYRIGLFIPLS